MIKEVNTLSNIESNYKIKSLDKLFSILEYFTQYGPEIGVTQISRDLKIHKSTVHRILAYLEVNGYMEKTANDSKYKLGIKFAWLGLNVLANLKMQNVLHDVMEELANKTKKTVHLAIQLNKEVMYLHKIENPESVVRYSHLGKTAPMYCTAMGKTILSSFSDDQLDDFFNEVAMSPHTKNTITRRDALIEELNSIKKNGFALDREELEIGLLCASAPIYNHLNKMIAALSLSGMAASFNNLEDLIADLLNYSHLASQKMGYRVSGSENRIKVKL